MKVSIITLHHVRNFGSMLQTYATQYVLEKHKVKVEVINFVPQGLTLKTGINTIESKGGITKRILRKVAVAITFSIRQAVMIRFNQKYINMSAKIYKNYEELKENPPEADVYISGSDQIWNTQNSNLPTDLKAYYLGFVSREKKKISYASSIGKDSFSNGEARMVSSYLNNYYMVSVREKQAVELLERIGLKDVYHVVDPTLLLSANEWRKFCEKNRRKEDKIKEYIFVYNLNRNLKLKKYAVNLSKEKNLKIVNFADTLDFIPGAVNRILNSPFDFIKYISQASYVLTDSFHGTAFAINFNRQFLTFPAPKYNSRIESLLEVFGLEKRLYQEGVNQLQYKIEYERVNDILKKERIRCLDILFKALKNNE